MTENEKSIAVIGGGPVGLAAALLLDRMGMPVTLVAPRPAHRDERTSALLGGSIDLLDRIGIWPDVAGAAAPMRSLRIVDATGRLIRAPEVLFHASELRLDVFGYNVPNAALMPALEAAVERRGIDRRTAVLLETRTDGETLSLTLSDGSRLSVGLAIAADGRNSTTRKNAGIATREWRYDQAALVLNLAHELSHEDISTEFHTPHGPFTLVPLGHKRSSLVWVGKVADTSQRAALTDEELAVEIERQSASILGAVKVDGARQVFPLAGMTATKFAAERVMLTGEAAHLFPPIGAQGLNLGYRDVATLEHVLSGSSADAGARPVLDAYDRARRGDVMLMTTAVDALNRSLLSAFLPVQAARSLGLYLLDSVPPLRRAMMRRILAPEAGFSGTDRPEAPRWR